MDQKKFRRIDVILGWVTILIAFVVYSLTMEPTTSFWDCGEFIASAYKLQVGHPPGAPLFAMIARVFALLAGGDVTKVAMMVNLVSVISSAFTIGFLFWTIVAVIKRIKNLNNGGKPFEWDTMSAFATLGSAFVGAVAYTFTDTFWFSAVEGEVYAISSWFTAIVFWAMLRWDSSADQPHSDRWIILIMYLMGLSIGVHLLNLLTIPAMALVYYFRKFKGDPKGAFATLGISMIIFLFITYAVIPGTISLTGTSELLFTNTLGAGFGTGLIVFVILLFGGLITSILLLKGKYANIGSIILPIIIGMIFSSIVASKGPFLQFLVFAVFAVGGYFLSRKSHYFSQIAAWSLLVMLIGYSSYALIGIRSKANTPMDENNPENVFSMIAYINREQYGSRALFNGPYYDARVTKYDKTTPIYIPAYEVIKKGNKKPVMSFQIEREANDFIATNPDKNSLTIRKRYVVSDYKVEPVYESSHFLPRIWSPEHVAENEFWGNVKKGEKPTGLNNITFALKYQIGWMYIRYFMWNFSGRESDIQGHGGPLNGNWITGIGPLDQVMLGYPQSNLPKEIAENKGRNKYYMLPFIFGLLGMIYNFLKDKKSFWAIFTLFFFTGLMIVFQNNAPPVQPRERDYVFAGSFYVFAIWIGVGVLGLIELIKKYGKMKDGIALAVVPISFLLVPVILGKENWDDHTRADRYTARDFAYNYLNSCAPNAILFTNGDNDTFPLWYLQEVEGVRTDVRVVNLSLLNTDWYITQMKRAAYDGKAVPFGMIEPEYRQGIRDQVLLDRSNEEYYTVQDQLKFLRLNDRSNLYKLPESNDELYFFKSNKFLIPVDSAKVANDTTFRKDIRSRIMKALPLVVNRSYLLKADVMIMDLLANFNWDRPIYFAITVGESNYLGLQDYFEVDGLAYRLMPYKVKSHDGQLGEINTEVMYDNMVNKFKWGNMNKKGVYLDETNLRMTMNLRNNFYRLATALFQEGKTDKALKCLDKTEELMPDDVVAYNYFNLLIADLYFKMGQKDKATRIVQTLRERTQIDVDYYASFGNKSRIDEEYRRSQQILQLCDQLITQIKAGTPNSIEVPQNGQKVDSLSVDSPKK
jgi:tetratricopeptide (TPR) repeat protein/MFS family permease